VRTITVPLRDGLFRRNVPRGTASRRFLLTKRPKCCDQNGGRLAASQQNHDRSAVAVLQLPF
jgi:hypothetical protein